MAEQAIPRKDPMAVLWVSSHRSILASIARQYKVTPQFVHYVLYGRRKSADGRIERALRESGAPVVVSAKPGSRFSAFGGALSGKMLYTIPGKLIVQAWRSVNFGKNDPDSILILAFSSLGKKGRIELTHVNVADRDAEGVRNGWKSFYWTPWRKYLTGK